MDVEDVRQAFEQRRDVVEERLEQFEQVNMTGERRWFEELCFCVLTANTSAEMGLEAMDAIRPVVHDVSADELSDVLEGVYRFYNVRAEYIVHNREKFGYALKRQVSSLRLREARAFLAREAKGIGFKEGSHFLRNVGVGAPAILDKHVLRCLSELGVVDVDRPSSREAYERCEDAMRSFAAAVEIPMDALDLVLWSMQTGEVLK